MSVIWDMNARRIAGIRYWVLGTVWKDGILAFVSMVPVAAVTYLATWTGWFLSKDAYDRNWAATNPSGTVGLDPGFPALPVALPLHGLQLPYGAGLRPPLQVQRLVLAGHGPAHLLLRPKL